MNLERALKKLKDFKYTKKGNFYYFEINSQILGFCVNSFNDIFCIHTRNKNDLTDIQTDYFAEIYHSNLTRALKSALC